MVLIADIFIKNEKLALCSIFSQLTKMEMKRLFILNGHKDTPAVFHFWIASFTYSVMNKEPMILNRVWTTVWTKCSFSHSKQHGGKKKNLNLPNILILVPLTLWKAANKNQFINMEQKGKNWCYLLVTYISLSSWFNRLIMFIKSEGLLDGKWNFWAPKTYMKKLFCR